MTGNFRVKMIWPPTKQEVFEMRVLKRDRCAPVTIKRLTRHQYMRMVHKRQGKYWKYLNRGYLRRLNFNRLFGYSYMKLTALGAL